MKVIVFPIGKAQRFEIFRRDGFCCQWCYGMPPDVVLMIRRDEEYGLVTSCSDCNRGGKVDKTLDVIENISREMEEQEHAYLQWREERDEDHWISGRIA